MAQGAVLHLRSSDVSAVSSPSAPTTAVPPFSPNWLPLRQTRDYGKDNGPKNIIHASGTREEERERARVWRDCTE
jgi:hypothetical protein